MTTSLPHGPGDFGARKWVALGLVIPVGIAGFLFGISLIAAAFDPSLSRAGHIAAGITACILLVVAARCIVVGFLVTDDYVRVRGVWATRTVRRDDVAGFVMECDAAGRFHFPAVVATDGRRVRARWAVRRAAGRGTRRMTQEIVDAFLRLGWYDETRLDRALNAVDAVRRDVVPAQRWQSAPGWPEPPPSWQPPAGWQPAPDWPAAPADWQFWQQLDVPVVAACDIETDPDEAPIEGRRNHLDPRYALDVEIAKGLPGSSWGLGEALQGFLWFALMYVAIFPIGHYVSDRLASVCAECGIGVAVVLAARKAAGQSGGWRRALGWELPKPRDMWFALRWFGWNLVGRFVAGIILVLITLPLRGKAQSNVDLSGHPSVLTILFLIFVAVIVAPIVEEFFFRGLLLRAFMRRYSFWPSAIVTSVLFGLAHVYQVDTARARIILGGSIAAFGVVQSMLVRRKGRLGPNMWVHGFANGLVVIFALA